MLLEDVFESFRDKCIEIYDLDPTNFLTAAGLAWQVCLKKLLTGIGMLLIVQKKIRGRICQPTERYAKASNKYLKNYNKNTES